MTLSFERVALPAVPWAELDQRPTRTMFQTRQWLDFLMETQDAEPVAARILDGLTPVGWFTGAIVRRGGFRFLGSPLRGWTTPAMGFDLEPGTDPTAVLDALPRFAFRDLGCVHLEIADREILDDALVPDGFVLGHLAGYQLDLVADDEEQLAAMKSGGRRDVRRSLRNGITVEPVDPLDAGTFAADYYAQVSEAFAKRDLTPTYPVERVDAILRHLGPTGRLLLLRANTPDGELAATGIFPGMPGSTAEYWMGGSYRRHQALLPNEALMWTALRAWQDRGAVRFNFGGGGSYKAKYGGQEHRLPWLRRSRFAGMERVRGLAYDVYRRRLRPR